MADNRTPTAAPESSTALAASDPRALSIVAAYEAMLAQVPDAVDDGGLNILETIANAATLADLNAPWQSANIAAYNGERLLVRSLRKRPSDFAGGLPFYLIIDAVVESTGEIVTVMTGSDDVVAQLVRAYVLGKLPARVIPRVAVKPTAAGYYPQHLSFVD